MIQIEQLVKVYDGIRAVDGLSMTVRPGEILGLVGPNGAGKTTTLRCVAGIIPATEGLIRVCGHDIVDEPVAARAQLAFVADEPHLFAHLTVSDHMTLFARLYGVGDAAPARSEELLRGAKLWERRNAFPGELSRGMKQKLLLSCALLHDPKVIILDEPLTGLDASAQRQLEAMLRVAKDDGCALLIVTHELRPLLSVGDPILLLASGTIVEEAAVGSRDANGWTDRLRELTEATT